jgi:hypothetical protein
VKILLIRRKINKNKFIRNEVQNETYEYRKSMKKLKIIEQKVNANADNIIIDIQDLN